MYAAIWRHLPGPLAVRILTGLILVLVVVAALFVWVFPAVAAHLPFNEVTVDGSSAGAGDGVWDA